MEGGGVAVGEVGHISAPGPREATLEWTVVEARAGETIGFAPTLTCFPRSWKHDPPAWSTEEEFRPVRLESVAFGQRYTVRVATVQDENWLLQLLSPAFMDWLTRLSSDNFGFELHEGVLRCFAPGHLDDARGEALRRDAAEVLERIRSEALESEGLGVRDLGLGVPERVQEAVEGTAFDALPAGSAEASERFRANAWREPQPYVGALGGIVGAYGALFGFLFELGTDMIDVIEFIVFFLPAKYAGVALGLVGVAGYGFALPQAVKISSHKYGRLAFAREYARARGLRLESPQSFHRRLMRVDLPAPAQFVLAGEVAERRDGWLALCRSRRGLLQSHFDAVVLEAAGLSGSGTDGELSYQVDAGYLVVSRSGEADRTVAGLDSLRERAFALAHRLAAASPQPTSTSSTSPSGS